MSGGEGLLEVVDSLGLSDLAGDFLLELSVLLDGLLDREFCPDRDDNIVRIILGCQKSTQISKTFSPTTPLSTHQSIDLGELYNFVVGVGVNG